MDAENEACGGQAGRTKHSHTDKENLLAQENHVSLTFWAYTVNKDIAVSVQETRQSLFSGTDEEACSTLSGQDCMRGYAVPSTWPVPKAVAP